MIVADVLSRMFSRCVGVVALMGYKCEGMDGGVSTNSLLTILSYFFRMMLISTGMFLIHSK